MTLIDLLDTAAEAGPNRDALVGLQTRFNWEQLHQATTAVAGALVADGIRPGDRVGVAWLKDARSFIAVHGVLRAGAIMVPIDPLAPPAAARAVLADAEISGLIGDPRTLGPLEPRSIDGVALRSLLADGEVDDPSAHQWTEVLAEGATALPRPCVDVDDPAYIIYTSGSTGRPKGIVHTHRSALAYAERSVRAHRLTAADRVAGIPPLHFDQSTFELYAAPMAQAAVVVMGEAHLRFPASLTQRSEQERISVWYSVPSLFRQLVERGGLDQRDLSALRLILYGGEPYPSGALRELTERLPGVSITNVYGPAEVNECTNHPIEVPVDVTAETPIGRPWDDVDVCVVDDQGAPVSPGAPGELWVAAPTMMQGYWREPDLTASVVHERFDGPPWYATGDMVVQDDDGLLWFKGRRDNQVKIRGVRVELEAVETVVGDAPGVAEAVVGPTADHAHLEAVVMARDGLALDHDAIRQFCATRLTQAAVPRAVYLREELPLTPSGKIDRALVRRELLNAEVGR